MCVDTGCEDGLWRCAPGGRQPCVLAEPECAVWGAIEACAEGTACEQGECAAAPCEDACEAGARRCTEGGVQSCVRTEACTAWSDPVACPDGTACAGAGECGVCVPGADEERACGDCGAERRVCGDDAQWAAWGGCEGQGACRAGAQEACGRCGTRTCNAQCAWGGCEGQGPCARGETGACGQCGMRSCDGQCQWGGCNNGDGTLWRRCNACGWQFCCPNGNWCNCDAHFPASCPGQSCVGSGVCQ